MIKGISYLVLSLIPLSSFAYGDDFYVGAFGGGGYSNYGSLSQRGIAFFSAERGGPLNVNATGNANNKSAWIAGLHAGREWQGWSICNGCQPWCLSPAGELEGYYLNSRISGLLDNPTTRLPEHLFDDSFKMNTGVLLVNSVWTFSNPCLFVQPYVGVGVGAAIISLYSANSPQVSPPEPGVNHFNSNTNDSDWAFAAQAKAGLRFNVARNWRLFAEYRYLYLNSTNYQFGSTQYPTHAATTKWDVHVGSMGYNLGSLGIEYTFDAIC